MSARDLIIILLYTLFIEVRSYRVVNKETNEIGPKISGGNEAIRHEAPWMVSIQRLDFSTFIFNHICGGSVLKPHIILTAAHCLVDFTVESGYVYAGRHNLNQSELSTQQSRSFNSSNVIIHEDYIWDIAPHDIGLIKLLNPFFMNDYVKEIASPPSNVMPYGSVRLYGWGRTVYEESGGVLMTAVTTTIDIKECNLNFTSEVLDTHICTASENTAACSGDSGGAVVQRSEDGVDTAVGIVSWGFRLCGLPPSVHTRVSAYIDWITINSAIHFQGHIQIVFAVCLIVLFFSNYYSI